MLHTLLHAWPWYVTGPLIGLFAPILLLIGNRQFGVSSNLRHVCAAVCPGNVAWFRYDWRRTGAWNLAFAVGILVGGFVAGSLLRNPAPVAISPHTHATLVALGIHDFSGLAPADLFSWANLATVRGALLLVGGGLLVGFGTAYAGGCTSGHGISGIADLQIASVIALIGFFVGGVLGTFVLLPLVLRVGA